MKKFYILITALLVLVAVSFAGGLQAHKVTVPLSFDYYYTNAMVEEALQALHKAYPHLTKLDLVGKSEEGRSIYCMTINNPKTGDALSKPGIYVDGNIHGNEDPATEVTLYLLNYLLTNYGSNTEITQLVDNKCFYVIPIVNVDGRYHFLTDPNDPSGNRTIRRPKDDDKDGLFDEDAPEDLNGDGTINSMRKKDPNGRWKSDPQEPRIMIPVKPGEKGEWTLLGDEGFDNDGDGMVNEDGPGYVDGNRNWGYDWMPNYVQRGAGDYPFSGVGLKAIADYIMTKPNICMGWAFHNTGGMFLRGPSTKAHGEFPREDVEFYDFVGEQSERIVPDYRYIIGWKDLYETYGDFMEWLVQMQGAYGFVGELFMSQHETFKSIKENKKKKPAEEEEGMGGFFSRDPEVEKQRLKFNDHLTQGELYNEWKPFKHPLYGDIEIGGWAKMSSRLPHPFMLKELVHRNASAIIFTAKHTPEVKMKVFGLKKVGDNLYRVRIRLSNASAMPSMSAAASRNKVYPKDMLTLSGTGIKVVTGGAITDLYRDKVSYKEFKPQLQMVRVPGFGKVEHQFLVSGSGKLTIKYQSRKAGTIVKTVELK